eukprot:6547206-Prymnesium_polylepis.2
MRLLPTPTAKWMAGTRSHWREASDEGERAAGDPSSARGAAGWLAAQPIRRMAGPHQNWQPSAARLPFSFVARCTPR